MDSLGAARRQRTGSGGAGVLALILAATLGAQGIVEGPRSDAVFPPVLAHPSQLIYVTWEPVPNVDGYVVYLTSENGSRTVRWEVDREGRCRVPPLTAALPCWLPDVPLTGRYRVEVTSFVLSGAGPRPVPPMNIRVRPSQ